MRNKTPNLQHFYLKAFTILFKIKDLKCLCDLLLTAWSSSQVQQAERLHEEEPPVITRATLWATGHPRPCCWRSRRIGAASNEGRLQQTLLLREIAQSQTCSPQHLMSSESHFVTTERFEFYSANSTLEITRSKNESFKFAHTRLFLLKF